VLQRNIIYRTIGKIGAKIPIVSMGVMNADNLELVRRAYEIGIRNFDTAANYQRCRNEKMVTPADLI
jgi:aryl-alcohol dehydrogenase-like predicted oxidoreductase